MTYKETLHATPQRMLAHVFSFQHSFGDPRFPYYRMPQQDSPKPRQKGSQDGPKMAPRWPPKNIAFHFFTKKATKSESDQSPSPETQEVQGFGNEPRDSLQGRHRGWFLLGKPPAFYPHHVGVNNSTSRKVKMATLIWYAKA